MELDVVFEDNHLLAVAKPAGLLVQGDRSGDVTLVDVAKAYLKRKYDKPGNVYLGLVHRLDRNTSGLVLLARTSKAAGRLSEQFRSKAVQKSYLAVTEGVPDTDGGELTAWLAARADRQGVTRAETAPFAEARESRLRWRVMATEHGRALLEVEPITGRRHQIRAQLALVGLPLLGDVKYGATRGLPDHRIALHARSLTVKHPVGGEPVVLTVSPPPDWPWPPS